MRLSLRLQNLIQPFHRLPNDLYTRNPYQQLSMRGALSRRMKRTTMEQRSTTIMRMWTRMSLACLVSPVQREKPKKGYRSVKSTIQAEVRWEVATD